MSPMIRGLIWQVWVQARADRAHGVIGAYVLLCILVVPLASGLSLGAGTRAAIDTGLLGLWVFTCVLAVWLGVRALGSELASGRAVAVLSGPTGISSWLLGRWLGLASLLGAMVLAMTGVWVLTAVLRDLPVGAPLLVFAVLTWVEGLVLATLAALLASRAQPLIAALSTGGLWLAGHLGDEYTRLMREWETPGFATFVFSLVPDLDRLNSQAAVVHGHTMAVQDVGTSVGFGLLWAGALGCLLVASATHRDLA